jgi:hypothetical protein
VLFQRSGAARLGLNVQAEIRTEAMTITIGVDHRNAVIASSMGARPHSARAWRRKTPKKNRWGLV